jgi:hypothetical protein
MPDPCGFAGSNGVANFEKGEKEYANHFQARNHDFVETRLLAVARIAA